MEVQPSQSSKHANTESPAPKASPGPKQSPGLRTSPGPRPVPSKTGTHSAMKTLEQDKSDPTQSEGPRRRGSSETTGSRLSRTPKDRKPVILMQSAPDIDERSDSWSDDSYASTDLEVEIDAKDEDINNEVALNRIRRLGNQKEAWKNSLDFYAMALSYLISPEALISAVYGFRKFGVNVSYPTLFFCAWLIAFPAMFMELALGQYTSTSIYSVYKFIAPAFRCTNALSLWMNISLMTSDFVIFSMTMSISWEILKLSGSSLRANSCFHHWNDIACENAINPCEKLSESEGRPYIPIQGRCVQERWHTELLRSQILSENSHRQLSPQYQYLVSHFASVNENGTAIGGFPSKELLVTITISVALLILAYKLPNRAIVRLSKCSLLLLFFFLTAVALSSRFKSESAQTSFPIKQEPVNWFTNDFMAWVVGHTLIVSKVGQGGLIALGSYNNVRNNLLLQTIVITFIAFLIPHIFAYLIYPFMDTVLWNSVEDYNLYKERSATFFDAYDRGFAIIWSDMLIAFFGDEDNGKIYGSAFIICLVLFFVTHKLIRLKSIILPACEKFGVSQKADIKMIQRGLLLFMNLYLWTSYPIPFRTAAFYATISGCGVIVVLEVICVFIFYGHIRFLSNINLMLFGILSASDHVRKFRVREIVNCFIIVSFGLLAFVVCPYFLYHVFLSSYRYIEVGGSVYPAFGYTIVFLGIVPLHAAYQAFRRWRKNLLIRNLFKPIPNLWGPREERDRRRADYLEGQVRLR